ncbi:MAG: hypothetical protein V2I27_05370 [Erythrobacter sp.]|jgi:hypothetical protein|nr:hypothetical protein [Erythrobacter sp.]
MALLVLIILGSSLGWFGSILMRTEGAGEILRQIGVGVATTVVPGLLLNEGGFLGGLTLVALGGGALSGILALVIYNAILARGDNVQA